MFKWLKDLLLGVVTSAALGFAWLAHKANKSRLHEAQEEADAIEEAMRQNAKADNADSNSELDKRVRDKYGKR